MSPSVGLGRASTRSFDGNRKINKPYILLPPDGGWGWMVVFGIALTNMFNQSLGSQFGLLFGEKLNSLGYGTSGAALIMNLNSVSQNLAGLIIGFAINKSSPRKVTIGGSILTSIGLILCSQAKEFWHIVVAYGLFVGLGLGLIAPAAFLAVNSYFTKRRGRAVGLALAGTGVGQMLMPSIVRILLETYDYRGTTLILGGLALNGVVGASFSQPVKWHMKKKYLKQIKMNESSQITTTTTILTDGDSAVTTTTITASTDDEQEEKRHLLETNKNKTLITAKQTDTNEASTSNCNNSIQIQMNPTNDKLIKQINNNNKNKLSLCQRINRVIDFSLLNDLTFTSIIVGLALGYTASVNFSMIFPFFLQETMGLNKSNTAMCMSILASSDLISRLTIPSITDKLNLSCRLTYLIGTILLGIIRGVFAETSNNVNNLYVVSAIYGFIRAIAVVNQNLCISEHIKNDKLPSALGLNMISKGLFVISIGQLLGWIRDYTNSFPLCLHAQNVLLAIIVIIWLPELYIKHYKLNKKRKKNNLNILT